ncbi:hypothetical protein D3C73_936410 [compost metagenome]
MQSGRIGLLFTVTHGRATVMQRNTAQLTELDAEPELLATRQREQFVQRVKVQHPAERRDHGELRRKTCQQFFEFARVTFFGQPLFDGHVGLDHFFEVFGVVGHCAVT